MKLATFTADGSTRVGVVTGGQVVDLSRVAPGLPADMLSRLEGGARAMTAVRAAGEALGDRIPLETVRLEAPIRPRKYLLIGRNYRSYESKTVAAPGDEVAAARLSRTINHLVDIDNMKAAGHQIWTNKQTSAVTGPFDTVLIPRNSEQVMYENELGVVIGTRCRYVSREDAPGVIAGYLICNDVTVTDWSWVSPTFMLGKSFDTHGPIGPWIVTPDELGDPHDLGMRVYVSGQLD
jgi:2-keto-4-pentenoate hydratase/2-oxohepta-3-ene-1,7-dioic acid hydratase in catechol pathway